MEKDITKTLAKNFYDFIINSTNGGYPAKMPTPNLVIYKIANYNFEIEFTEKYRCEVEITDSSKIKEIVSIPYYKNSNKPNWSYFFKGISSLARKLNKP